MIDDESYLGAVVAVLDDLVVRLEAQGLARQAELARELRRRPSRAPAVRGRPPVLALLDDAFPAHGQRVAAPWDALRVLAAGLPWTRTGSYLHAPPNPGFLDRYSHATIIGPTDGDGPRAPRDEAALGVVLLGPVSSTRPTSIRPTRSTSRWERWRGSTTGTATTARSRLDASSTTCRGNPTP